MASQQLKELRLQRRAGTIGVEIREKRVVGVFEDGRCLELRREPLGKPSLADPNWALDGEIMKGHSGAEYSLYA